ncbi:unnamed protein product [Linum tenue]|uniref:Uncharacterized protein n=1 Tax=Linum tenue TaxID=586396 RepID=A0AAV0NQE5_9ROSI|nr:unnamed protein product [Linum tenue]
MQTIKSNPLQPTSQNHKHQEEYELKEKKGETEIELLLLPRSKTTGRLPDFLKCGLLPGSAT